MNVTGSAIEAMEEANHLSVRGAIIAASGRVGVAKFLKAVAKFLWNIAYRELYDSSTSC